MYDKRREATEFEKQLRKSVKIFRQKRKVTNDFTPELLEHFAGLKPSESTKQIRNSGIAWLFHDIGSLMSFDVNELANLTGIEIQRIQSYPYSFAVRFGAIESRYYRLPAPTHPLSTRPIIEQDAKYFCPVPAQLYHGFREATEILLKPDSENTNTEKNSLWQRYERSRARYLELKTLEYLQSALKHVRSYNNLKYKVQENDQEKEVQLDGLIIFDSALFFVEAKAGTLSPSARRGAQKRMVDDLKQLIKSAYSQALRAKNYFNKSDTPAFYLEDNSEVRIVKQDIDRIYLITVTLDNLDAFIANLYQLDEFEFFASNEYPWACKCRIRQTIK